MTILDKKEIRQINETFKSKPWIRIVDPVDVEDNGFHKGKIEIENAKDRLKIDVIIDKDFPFGKIGFICISHKGVEHEMPNGLLCLNVAPAKNLQDKIELELEKLRLWIEKYFINEEKDEHFEYYQFNRQRNIQMLFEEDSDKPLPKTKYGKFSYGQLNEFNTGSDIIRNWIAADLGGRKNRWSVPYQKLSNGKHTGLWLFLSTPPIIQRRETIQNWEDLLNVMSTSQTQFLYDEQKKMRNQSAYQNSFLLLLGYEIKSGNKKEMHWDMILLSMDDFPYSSLKIGPGNYAPLDLGKEVDWCRTTNASYQRLFGRGKLSDRLTNSKILILGTGAIGSSLFIALVRGGCKEIEISDFDNVDPGNICRGNFSFKESFTPKIIELLNSAVSISPYVNVSIAGGITAIRKSNKNYISEKDKLMKFEYIFDCTTDKYLSIMLDEMNLKGQIINFSLTDKANHFVCITGNGNIHITKNNFYNRVSSGKAEPFFVATGCWHPTFQASFVDINSELMFSLNEINNKLETGESIRSFYIIKILSATNTLTYELSYNV